MTLDNQYGMKRIEADDPNVSAFERFYAVDFGRLMRECGTPKYGENGLSVIGWYQLAALAMFKAMGEPDFRDKPWPTEQHGGWWIGVPRSELEVIHESKPMKRNAKTPAKEVNQASPFDSLPLTGETCSECGLFQRESPGGATCGNGHGGAEGEKPQVHYWYHPESDSLFSTNPGEVFPGDPLVEHIDAETYHELEHRRAKDDPFACLDAASEPEDPFAIL